MPMPTKHTLLDIYAYYVRAFTLRALDEYDPDRESSGVMDIDYNIGRQQENPKDYRIVMQIDLAKDGYTSAENSPYSIATIIVGHFVFAEDAPEDEMQRMIHLNGLSILFGIARGFVGQATGASLHGQFVLPTVDFVQLVNERAERNKATTNQPQIEAPAEASAEK